MIQWTCATLVWNSALCAQGYRKAASRTVTHCTQSQIGTPTRGARTRSGSRRGPQQLHETHEPAPSSLLCLCLLHRDDNVTVFSLFGRSAPPPPTRNSLLGRAPPTGPSSRPAVRLSRLHSRRSDLARLRTAGLRCAAKGELRRRVLRATRRAWGVAPRRAGQGAGEGRVARRVAVHRPCREPSARPRSSFYFI